MAMHGCHDTYAFPQSLRPSFDINTIFIVLMRTPRHIESSGFPDLILPASLRSRIGNQACDLDPTDLVHYVSVLVGRAGD